MNYKYKQSKGYLEEPTSSRPYFLTPRSQSNIIKLGFPNVRYKQHTVHYVTVLEDHEMEDEEQLPYFSLLLCNVLVNLMPL